VNKNCLGIAIVLSSVVSWEARAARSPRSISVAEENLSVPEEGAIYVRGTRIELPLDLRILIQDFQSGKLNFSGLELSDEKGRKIPGETLSCKRRERKRLLIDLGDFLHADDWVCEAPGFKRALTQTLRLTVRAGFVALNHNMLFRGAVELVPRGNGKLSLVNDLDMESYLAGLVNMEIRSDYPAEAVKAQIIAARSYALAVAAERRKGREFYDLVGSEFDQVFQGSHVEDAQSYKLVQKTRGVVLFHREDVLKAYYHSSSGGYSEIPENVWKNGRKEPDHLAYLARQSPVDNDVAASKWQVTLSPKVGWIWPEVGQLTDVQVLERSSGRRVKKIRLMGENGTLTLTGTEFRRRLGNRWLKSTFFFVKKIGANWILEGRGFGHGVGLSQLGAREMANRGKKTTEILSFYYPFTSLRRLDLVPRPKPLEIRQLGAR